MHAEVAPTLLTTQPGQKVSFEVIVHNDTTVISAYRVSMLGVDPSWVTTQHDALSLFPDQTRSLTVTLAIPRDYPSGRRDLAIQVTSLNDPTEFALTQLALEVEPVVDIGFELEPALASGGKRTTFSVVVSNRGNTAVEVEPTMVDDEEIATADFDPPIVALAPSEQQIIEALVTGKRPWLASPAVRVLHFGLDGLERPPEKVASFMQRPIIGRWLLSLLGLMAAAAVFAVVLSSSFGDVVDEAKLDQALIESALAQDDEEAGEAGGAGGDVVAAPAIGGTVKIRGTDAGVSGATIELFAADNALVPVRTAATDVDGRFSIPGLADGAYRVSVQAAGFGASWYERATSFEAATDIEVAQGDPDPDLSIELGGEPGSISGLVVGEDPSGAFVRLLIRGELIDANLDPEVAVVEVTATGIFEFPVVPAPATYEIVVTKPGFAVERRLITLQAGEARTRVEIVLQQGDGVISGQVSDGADPLGGVTVSATDGTNTFQTVSLTTPEATGSYVLRELSTPATYTITFTKPGFVSASQTITLAEGQTQEGVDITLRRAAGSISGTVSATPAGSPSAEPRGGVTVTATNGDDTFVTTTLSIGAVGTYLFENLPVPSTYTLTFSGDGLISQTRSVGVNGEETGIDAVLGAAVGVISGTVSSPTSSPGVTPVVNGPTGGVTVSLTDGVTTLETLVADDPIGRYEIDNVPPGTYTITFARPGSSPVTQLVSISPGEALPLDVVIGRQASISGLVTDEGGEPIIGAGVRLFLVEDFPTGTPIATFTTSSDGVYEFTELDAPTTYVVEFAPTPGGVGAASRTVDLGAGEQLTGIDATI